MNALRFVVPMPPTLTNSGAGRSRGFWAQHREKKAYWSELDLWAAPMRDWTVTGQQYEIPQPPAAPLAAVRIASVMHLGGAMDDDNAMARHKWLLDWLRKRRYIADDRKRNVKWEGFPEQIVKRDGNYRIELTLTPL